MFIFLFPGSRVSTDQRVVAKQEIQKVESTKRAGAQYAHCAIGIHLHNTFLVLLVNDSEYSNSTAQKLIQCHCGIYSFLLARCVPPPHPAPFWGEGKYHKKVCVGVGEVGVLFAF